MSEPRPSRFPLPLTLLFVLCLALTALASAALVIASIELGRSVRQVEHTLQVQRTLEILQLTVVDAETGQRGFLLSGQPHFLEPYVNAVARQAYYFGTLKRLTADNPAQQQALQLLQPLVDQRLQQLSSTMRAWRESPGSEALLEELNRGKQLMDRVRVGLEGMRNEEERMLQERQADVDRRGRYGIIFLLLSNAASLLGLAVLYAAMRRYERRRRSAQAQLASSEREFRELFDASPVAQAECDVHTGRLLHANRRLAELTGFTPEELTHTTVVDLLPREHRLDNARAYRDLVGGERQVMRIEQSITRKDRSTFWALVQVGVAFGSDGAPQRTLLTVDDITQPKRVHDAREGAYALLRAAAEGTAGLVFAKDFEGRYRLANNALNSAFGRDVIGHTDEEILGNVAAAAAMREHDLKVMAAREPVTVEETIAFPTGPRTLLVTKAPYVDRDGELAGIVGIATDISARVEAEFALRAKHEALLRELAARDGQIADLSQWLLRVSEEERARLAMELHDELGASITAVWVDVVKVLTSLRKIAPELADRQQRALEALTSTSEKMRRVTSGLHPVTLSHLGLAGAIEDLLRAWRDRNEIEVHSSLLDPQPPLAPEQELALFRIAQEALTNIAKYADARHVKVALHSTPDEIRLTVLDDGKGLSPEPPRRNAQGMINMRERLRPFGGTVTVGPGPDGKGTEVLARLPRSPAPGAADESDHAATAERPAAGSHDELDRGTRGVARATPQEES